MYWIFAVKKKWSDYNYIHFYYKRKPKVLAGDTPSQRLSIDKRTHWGQPWILTSPDTFTPSWSVRWWSSFMYHLSQWPGFGPQSGLDFQRESWELPPTAALSPQHHPVRSLAGPSFCLRFIWETSSSPDFCFPAHPFHTASMRDQSQS